MTGADIALVLLVLGLVGLTVWLFWPERQVDRSQEQPPDIDVP